MTKPLLSVFLLMATSVHSEPLVIAHRGASAIAPENTASAIREALRLGAKVIEFDVRTTSDGELVLFHDKELDRLALRPGTIESLDWATVQTLDVGKWFTKGSFAGEPVPRFEEAVKLCLAGGAIPLIEHKTGDAGDYARVIRGLNAMDRVIVQSFDWKFLAEFRKAMPEVPIGALGGKEFDAAKRAELAALKPDWIGWNFKDLKESEVAFAHGLGAKLALWTVNDPAIAKSWVERGADAIITDVPDGIAGALGL
jgi:glycerophosphoryl diester phosphodiesterase